MACPKAAASAGAGGWTRRCPWSWGRAGTEAAGGFGVDAAGFGCAGSQGAPLGKPSAMEWGARGVVVWGSPGLPGAGAARPPRASDQRRCDGKGRCWAHAVSRLLGRGLGGCHPWARVVDHAGSARPPREESGGDAVLGCSLEGASCAPGPGSAFLVTRRGKLTPLSLSCKSQTLCSRPCALFKNGLFTPC